MTEMAVRLVGPDNAAATVTALDETDREALFTSPPTALALLAWDDARLAAFAAHSFLESAVGLTRSLSLTKLHVGDDYWGHGIGELLMQAIFDVAGNHECIRVAWTTDRDNTGALAFYANLGLDKHSAKVSYWVPLSLWSALH